MNWKGNTEQLPTSPFYLDEKGQLPSAQKVAISGNLFHKWRPLELPETEDERVEPSHPEENDLKPSATAQESRSQDTEPTIPTTFIPDIELLRAASTIEKVVNDLSSPPSIKNDQVNWIEKWSDSSYKDIGIREESREFGESDTLFKQILPLDKDTSQTNPTENMEESKFLRWLKDKEAQRQGYHLKKTEDAVPKKEKTQDSEKQNKFENEPRSTDSKKLSKKERKKELKKILKKSLTMEDEIVSETLANIMVQQGHISKAIEMYERLSLIFPEKSSYFADIIQKLEEE